MKKKIVHQSLYPSRANIVNTHAQIRNNRFFVDLIGLIIFLGSGRAAHATRISDHMSQIRNVVSIFFWCKINFSLFFFF